jgi:hypothetical protein
VTQTAPDTISACHSALARDLGSQLELESIEVVQQVDQYRQYWRPDKPRLVLLAESHVHTTETELLSRLRPDSVRKDLAHGFVRFVYCLGYGENELLDKPLSPNSGTWQFWKIFYSCINLVQSNEDFAPMLKAKTKLRERINYKIELVEDMKAQGIWLVDASHAALFRNGHPKIAKDLYEKALQTCWTEHVRSVLEHPCRPEGILCIGCGVARALKDRLEELQIPWGAVPQPGSHLSSKEHLRILKRYREVAKHPARVRSLCADLCGDLFS